MEKDPELDELFKEVSDLLADDDVSEEAELKDSDLFISIPPDSELFHCTLCDKVFEDTKQRGLQKHFDCFHREDSAQISSYRLFHCIPCNFVFIDLKEVKLHLMRSHLVCTACGSLTSGFFGRCNACQHSKRVIAKVILDRIEVKQQIETGFEKRNEEENEEIFLLIDDEDLRVDSHSLKKDTSLDVEEMIIEIDESSDSSESSSKENFFGFAPKDEFGLDFECKNRERSQSGSGLLKAVRSTKSKRRSSNPRRSSDKKFSAKDLQLHREAEQKRRNDIKLLLENLAEVANVTCRKNKKIILDESRVFISDLVHVEKRLKEKKLKELTRNRRLKYILETRFGVKSQ